MKLSKGFRDWVARRGALVVFFAVLMLLWIVPLLLEKPESSPITRTLASSTQHVEVLWFRQDISPYITANAGVLYAIPLGWSSLAAFNIKTGSVNWEVELPFEERGINYLFANESSVFTVTATHAYAYKAKTGELKWATELGDGHVSIVSELYADELRIQYGDKLIELDPKTGKILDEGLKPQNTDMDIRLVGGKDKRICSGNLQTGEDHWCRIEIYISEVAVDLRSQIGYAMRDDFVLVTIDLKNGDVLGETKFLSSEPAKEYSGFLSSVVFSEGVVVVSFYDSGQVFGLSFSQ